MKRIPILASVVLFILLCVSGSFWVMRLIKPEVRKITPPQINRPDANVDSVASLFGGVIEQDVSYQLTGIVEANPMSQSVAIITVDGKPAKAYPINTEVNTGSDLKEVYARYVMVSANGVSKRVELPQETAHGHITPVANQNVEDENPADSQFQPRAPIPRSPRDIGRGTLANRLGIHVGPPLPSRGLR